MSQSFITFEAELPWIYPLAFELGSFGPSVAISLRASSNPFRRSVNWPYPDPEDRIRKEVWSYPPGFNRKLGFLFDWPIRSRLNETIRRLFEKTGSKPYVILPNPRFLPYVRDVDPAKLIYLNYDDYSIDFNTIDRAESSMEEALIKQAKIILCASAYQTKNFKERFPLACPRIFHFPHGVHKDFINPDPSQAPGALTVCVNGRLTSRYDWELIEEVVTRLPAVMFLFVGAIETAMHSGQRPDWLGCLQRVLDRPNVQHQGGLKHFDTRAYYWQSAINWTPYKADLSFVKASCPLKIMDGLASGQPVVSADVPECRLYPEWVSIYRNVDEAVALITNALNTAETSASERRRAAQIQFARKNTWARRARMLVEILECKSTRDREPDDSKITRLACTHACTDHSI